MARISNLYRRGAVYWWRRRTRCPDGSLTLAISLRTRDPREARRRCASINALFERVNRALATGEELLTSEIVKRVYEHALKMELDNHESERLVGHYANPTATAGNLRAHRIAYEVMAGRRPYPSSDELSAAGWSEAHINEFELVLMSEENRIDSPVDDIVDQHFPQYVAGPGLELHYDREREALIRAAYGGYADAALDAENRLSSPAPLAPAKVAIAAKASTPDDIIQKLADLLASTPALAGRHAAIPDEWQGLTVGDAMKRFIAESSKGKGWTSDSQRRALDAAWLLDGVTGGAPCYEVRQQHLKRLSDVFDELPVNRGKSSKETSLSLDELLTLTSARLADGTYSPDQVGLKPVTINVRVRDLVRLFRWLAESEKLPVGDLYWLDLRRAEDPTEDSRDKKPPWTEEEASLIFRQPMWTGCDGLTKQGRKRVGDLVIHDAAYWVAPLAWYHGLRREELCKLRLDELDFENEIPHMLIQTSEEGGLKTARAKRRVPIHSEVLRLGLRDYVEMMRAEKETLLFPELKPAPKDVKTLKGDRPALERKRGDVYFKNWWTHIARLAFPGGVPKDIHAFRHAFADAIEEVEEKAANDLLGHKSGSLRLDVYGSASHLAKLRDAVERVPVVTGHLTPMPINLLPRSLRGTRPSRAQRAKVHPEQSG